jgi:hypothetical protein
MGSISAAIAKYDEEHAFARQLFLPEEERAKYTTVKWEWLPLVSIAERHFLGEVSPTKGPRKGLTARTSHARSGPARERQGSGA